MPPWPRPPFRPKHPVSHPSFIPGDGRDHPCRVSIGTREPRGRAENCCISLRPRCRSGPDPSAERTLMLWKLTMLLVLAWAAIMPPLFTRGACSAEFDAESRRVEADRPALASPARAEAYWRERNIAFHDVSHESCRRSRPRFVVECGDGPLVYARVPVRNDICRIYRDDSILVQLQYDARGRLARMQADMAPFKSLPIPFLHTAIDWAR